MTGLTLLRLALTSCLVVCAPAAERLVDFDSPGPSETESTFSLGYSFSVDSDIWVTHLGTYDYGPCGIPDGLAGPQQVGIWALDGTLLASAEIEPLAALQGMFRYSEILPVKLEAGSSYVIATQGVDAPGEGWTTEPPSATLGLGIMLIEPRFAFVSPTDALTFPSQSGVGFGYFGPNAIFESVPEPAPLFLVGCGIGGILLMRLRRLSS